MKEASERREARNHRAGAAARWQLLHVHKRTKHSSRWGMDGVDFMTDGASQGRKTDNTVSSGC